MGFYEDTLQGLLEAVAMEYGNFMNIPEIVPIMEENIVEEYRKTNDIKRVKKVFLFINQRSEGRFEAGGNQSLGVLST